MLYDDFGGFLAIPLCLVVRVGICSVRRYARSACGHDDVIVTYTWFWKALSVWKAQASVWKAQSSVCKA